MTTHNLDVLRTFLLDARAELLAEGDAGFQPNRQDHTQVPDEDEQPLTEMQQVIASARNKRRTEDLQRIEVALQRMKDEPEDFGLCLECDEPIPLGRMKVKPWALYCVACLQAKEHPHQSNRRRHALDFHE